MRSRSNSGVRLDGYARLVHQTILCHQVSEWVSPVITEDVQCDNLNGDPGWTRVCVCLCVCVCVCVCVCILQVLPPPSWGGRKGPWSKEVLRPEQNPNQGPLARSPELELLSSPPRAPASPMSQLGSRGQSCMMLWSLFMDTDPDRAPGLGALSFPSAEEKRSRGTFSHL